MATSPIQVQAHPGERGERRGVVLNAGCCCCCCCCCLHTLGGLVGAMLGSAQSAGSSAAPRWMPPPPPPDVLADFNPRQRPSEADDAVIDRLGPPTSEEIVEALTSPGPELPDVNDEERWPTPSRRYAPPPVKGLGGVGLYWLVLLVLTPIASVLFAYHDRPPRRSEDVFIAFLGVIFLGLPAVQLAASVVAALLVLFWPPDEREVRLAQVGRITLWSFGGTLIGLGVMALFCLPCLLSK